MAVESSIADVEKLEERAALVREFALSPDPTYIDENGDTRYTLAGLETLATGVPAVGAAAEAVAAKNAAEHARDAALIQAGVYVDEPSGRAAVGDGEAFKVQGSGDVAAYEYRRINSSSSELIAVYPASSYIKKMREDLDDSGAAIYRGTGPVLPISTDSTGRVLLGYNVDTESVVGDGLVTDASIAGLVEQLLLSPAGQSGYTGAGPIYPIVTDSIGQVLLGYDAGTEKIVGRGISESSAAPAPGVSLAEKPIAAAVNHLLFYGQSLSVGATATTVLSTTQPYSNVTFNGGPRAWTGSAWDFSAFKPLVEDAVNPAPDGSANRGETVCSGAANYACTLAAIDGHVPADHVILASTAGHGGYRIDQLHKGALWYSNLLAHVSGAKALNADYACHAIGWMQGENDVAVTNYATYRSRLEQLQADAESDIQAISGQTSPVFCLTYQTSWQVTQSPDIALAQLDLSQNSDRFFMVTPCYHLPFATDNVHLTNVGYKWMGAYFGRAYKQLAIDGVKPKWLNPVSATRRGTAIRVRFDVPHPPMVLDTATLAATTDFGFKVLDGATPAVISSIAVDGSDIVITLSAVPSGAVTVRYGLDYLGSGLGITNGGSGNLRDSEPSTITIGGIERPLYNVSPHFSLTAIPLGE